MAFVSDDTLYRQTKILIGFLCRQKLNPKSLIQLSKTLLVEPGAEPTYALGGAMAPPNFFKTSLIISKSRLQSF